MRLSRVAALLVVAPWLSACGAYFNDFDIVNGSKVEIRDLSVSEGRQVWPLGSLKPGAQTSFHGHLSGEDTGTISWTIDGRRYSADGCFYTVGSSTRASLTVVGGHIEYRCT